MSVGRMRGIKAVIDATARFPNDAALAEWALACLANLTRDNEDNRASFVQYGGIGAVLTTMHRHITSADICRNACATLYHVALSNRVWWLFFFPPFYSLLSNHHHHVQTHTHTLGRNRHDILAHKGAELLDEVQKQHEALRQDVATTVALLSSINALQQ